MLERVPRILDGARVLSVAAVAGEQFGHNAQTGASVRGEYAAVAQYVGDQPQVYLFLVSAEHQVIGDTLWGSVEEAKSMAEMYGIEPDDWVAMSG